MHQAGWKVCRWEACRWKGGGTTVQAAALNARVISRPHPGRETHSSDVAGKGVSAAGPGNSSSRSAAQRGMSKGSSRV